jgi:PAS domain S-box-containing protein
VSETSLYSTIIETTRALIIVLDAEGRVVMFNPACERVSGYRFEEVRGRVIWDFLLTPEEREPVKTVFRELRAGNFPNQFQNYWVTKSGALRFIQWSNSAVTDDNGRVARVIGTGIDVTDRRDAEAQLHESQARFQEVASAIPLVLWILDPHSNQVHYVSPGFEKIWGRSLPDPAIAFEIFRNSIHPDDREAMFRKLQRQAADVEPGHSEYRIIRPDGEVRWIRSRTFPMRDARGEIRRIMGYAEDVTERKVTEQALEKSEARLQALSENALDITAIVAADKTIQFITPSVKRILGYATEDLIGRKCFDICHPDDVTETEAAYQRAIDNPGTVTAVMRRMRHADGSWINFESFWISLLADPHINGIVVTSRDVTGRVRAQQALREAQGRERALLDSIPYAAWLKDAAGRYIAVNQAFRDRFEDDFPDPVGKTNRDIFPAEIATKQTAEDQEVIRTRMPLRLERPMRIGEGNERWIEVIKVPIIDESGDVIGITGVAHDVTERKLAEAGRIARDAAQRDALVKEIHHRIKNNLQGTITLIEQLATGHPESKNLLDAAITRLNTIATVHGLYGTTGERELRLEQIILRLVSSLKSFHADRPVQLSVSNPVSARVSESEIVPLALIVNELIMNAIKYSRATVDDAPVEIMLEGAGNGARIVIRNSSGRFPRHFDFDAGVGLGTGLSLVKSLLPLDGALLRFESMAGPAGAQVELTLSPPVIVPSASTT